MSRSVCGNGKRPSSYGGPELQSSTSARRYSLAVRSDTADVLSVVRWAGRGVGAEAETAAPARTSENSRRFIGSSYERSATRSTARHATANHVDAAPGGAWH